MLVSGICQKIQVGKLDKLPEPTGEGYLFSLETSIFGQIPLTSMVYFYNSTEYFPLNQTSTGFYSVAAHEIYNMISWTTRLYFANTRDNMHCSPYNVFFLLQNSFKSVFSSLISIFSKSTFRFFDEQ